MDNAIKLKETGRAESLSMTISRNAKFVVLDSVRRGLVSGSKVELSASPGLLKMARDADEFDVDLRVTQVMLQDDIIYRASTFDCTGPNCAGSQTCSCTCTCTPCGN